jgi:hypothetical protein
MRAVGTDHPEDEETQQVPRRDPSARRQPIWNIVVPISEYATHEDSRDSAAIVSLCCEIDDSNDRSDQNVKTGSANASSSADVHRESNEVFDRSAAVEDDHHGQDCWSDWFPLYQAYLLTCHRETERLR